MSGIVGIINLDGAPVDRELLQRMTEFMAYRGPDAQEIWTDGDVGFGHTMLRTTYESEREKQPCTLDGQVWVTADARIDARTELKHKLETKVRHNVNLATDVELILHAYHVWGEDSVRHLLGDFAFAIWDGKRKRLFCARDQFGVKLFYYARVANCFIFSNTLNCLRKHPAVSTKLNELAIGDFLLFGYNPEVATTTFSDVQRLPPAHKLTLSDQTLNTDRYWLLSTDGHIIRYKRDSDYVDHFKALLRDSVADRLRMDKVAIFMSGGLDSTTIAATVCELKAKHALSVDLRAYCCVSDKSPDEERYYSGLVAESLGIPIHYIAVDNYKMFERWDEPQLRRPEPYDAPLMAIDHDLLREAMSHSRVVLYGEDGDSLLFPASVIDMLRGLPFGKVIADVMRYMLSYHQRPLLGLGILRRIKRWMGKQRKEAVYPLWLNAAFATRLGLPDRWKKEANSEPSTVHPVRPEAYRRLMSSFWQTVFESSDPGVTFASVEYRLPLLDLRVVDFLLAIPPLPWCANKELLRKAMRGTLPEQVCRRPKSPVTLDPYQLMLQRRDAQWVDEFEPTQTLSKYVERQTVPQVVGGTYDPDISWIHLRPLILNYWLQSLDARELEKKADLGGLCHGNQ